MWLINEEVVVLAPFFSVSSRYFRISRNRRLAGSIMASWKVGRSYTDIPVRGWPVQQTSTGSALGFLLDIDGRFYYGRWSAAVVLAEFRDVFFQSSKIPNARRIYQIVNGIERESDRSRGRRSHFQWILSRSVPELFPRTIRYQFPSQITPNTRVEQTTSSREQAHTFVVARYLVPTA